MCDLTETREREKEKERVGERGSNRARERPPVYTANTQNQAQILKTYNCCRSEDLNAFV